MYSLPVHHHQCNAMHDCVLYLCMVWVNVTYCAALQYLRDSCHSCRPHLHSSTQYILLYKALLALNCDVFNYFKLTIVGSPTPDAVEMYCPEVFSQQVQLIASLEGWDVYSSLSLSLSLNLNLHCNAHISSHDRLTSIDSSSSLSSSSPSLLASSDLQNHGVFGVMIPAATSSCSQAN